MLTVDKYTLKGAVCRSMCMPRYEHELDYEVSVVLLTDDARRDFLLGLSQSRQLPDVHDAEKSATVLRLTLRRIHTNRWRSLHHRVLVITLCIRISLHATRSDDDGKKVIDAEARAITL